MCCGGGDVHWRGDMLYPASLSTSEAEPRKDPWYLTALSLAFLFLSLLIITSHWFMPIIIFQLLGARNKLFGTLEDKWVW